MRKRQMFARVLKWCRSCITVAQCRLRQLMSDFLRGPVVSFSLSETADPEVVVDDEQVICFAEVINITCSRADEGKKDRRMSPVASGTYLYGYANSTTSTLSGFQVCNYVCHLYIDAAIVQRHEWAFLAVLAFSSSRR